MLRRIKPNVIWSRPRMRSAGALTRTAMLTFLVTACAGSATTTGPADAGVAGRGVLTGAINFVGGPAPLPPGKQRPPAGGPHQRVQSLRASRCAGPVANRSAFSLRAPSGSVRTQRWGDPAFSFPRQLPPKECAGRRGSHDGH